jgi:hypothetical protein
VATLDLSSRDVSGDVAVGAGYYAEDQLDGASTPFAEFEVWSLQAAPLPAPDGSDSADKGGAGFVLRGEGEIIFDIFEREGSELFGLAAVRARDGETEIELDAFATTGREEAGIYEGSCDALPLEPVFALDPVDVETLKSVTTVAVPFADLTDGSHAIAVRGHGRKGAILACNAIPTP